MFYRDFEKETLKKGLLLPSFPASRDLPVGGMASNNLVEKNISLRQTIDYVKELKVILRDGKEYNVGPISEDQLVTKKSIEGLEGEV